MYVFASLFVNQNLFLFFLSYQGFRLNFIKKNARTFGGGVDKRHVVEWFKVCCEATRLSPKETGGKLGYFKFESRFVTFSRHGQNWTVFYSFLNVNKLLTMKIVSRILSDTRVTRC